RARGRRRRPAAPPRDRAGRRHRRRHHRLPRRHGTQREAAGVPDRQRRRGLRTADRGEGEPTAVTLGASILADSTPAVAAATVLENLVDGAIFSVGQAQAASPDEILPTPDARVVAVHVDGDPPTVIALALAPGLASRILTPGQELVDAAGPALAAAVS